MKNEKAQAIDRQVGANIRRIRNSVGMSQSELGKALGITFQQVQKNESGANRAAASTLHLFAQRMGCSIMDFFDGIGSDNAALDLPVTSPEARRIADHFDAIKNPRVKLRVAKLVAELAGDDTEE